MRGQTKELSCTNNTEASARKYSSIRNATLQPYSNPPDQTSSTQPKKPSSDTFIPIARSWDQPCAYPSAPTATERRQNSYTPESRWLSEPQRKQPWNAIGGVPARPFGPSPAKDVAKGKKDQTKDSERATRGSGSNSR